MYETSYQIYAETTVFTLWPTTYVTNFDKHQTSDIIYIEIKFRNTFDYKKRDVP